MMNPSGGFFEALTDKYDAAKKIIADARIEVPGDEKLRIKKRKRGKGASEWVMGRGGRRGRTSSVALGP
jgi:hypothetical protein